MSSSEHKEFEDWCLTQGWNSGHLHHSKVNGKYAWCALNDNWATWQAARGAQASAEPVATLHDDGYYTFKRGQEPQGARYAGWRMDVYAAPQQAQSDYVLQLLVAAGHVTQAKVDEARAIAADLGITDAKESNLGAVTREGEHADQG